MEKLKEEIKKHKINPSRTDWLQKGDFHMTSTYLLDVLRVSQNERDKQWILAMGAAKLDSKVTERILKSLNTQETVVEKLENDRI